MCNIVVIYTPNFFPIQDNKLFNFGEADANTGGGSPMGPRWSPPPRHIFNLWGGPGGGKIGPLPPPPPPIVYTTLTLS